MSRMSRTVIVSVAPSRATKVRASHLSMLSKPDTVTTVIESAARATG